MASSPELPTCHNTKNPEPSRHRARASNREGQWEGWKDGRMRRWRGIGRGECEV